MATNAKQNVALVQN